MKIKLMELAHYFQVHTGRANGYAQVIVRSSLMQGKIDLTFSVGGEDREYHPASVVEGIQQALEYVRKHVPVQDLVEMDPGDHESE